MKRVFVIILAVMLMLSLSGCAQREAGSAQDALHTKYGCEFQLTQNGVKAYGDTVKVYVTPDFDETLAVRAELNRQTRRITDNLIDRLVGRSFSKELDAALSAKGGFVSSWTSFVCEGADQAETDVGVTVDEYMSRYRPSEAMVYFALDKKSIHNDTAQILTDTFSELSRKYQTEIVLYGVILDEDFADCAEEIKEQPELSSSWFHQFDTKDAFQYAVKDGTPNLSIADLQAILNGE